MIVYHMKGNPSVERFIMDKCSSSVHFALQVYWFLEAAVQDASMLNNKAAVKIRKGLRMNCETSTVNGPTNMKMEDAQDMELATHQANEQIQSGSKLTLRELMSEFDSIMELVSDHPTIFPNVSSWHPVFQVVSPYNVQKA